MRLLKDVFSKYISGQLERRLGITTVEEALRLTDKELLSVPGVGKLWVSRFREKYGVEAEEVKFIEPSVSKVAVIDFLLKEMRIVLMEGKPSYSRDEVTQMFVTVAGRIKDLQ